MYSLYKQATVGNVKTQRPGIWDMLGRAKWDAWAKNKDLEAYEAKWLYVDAMLKVLRKYSDKTVARDLVNELESFGGDPANLVMSGELSKSRGSNSSGSTRSEEDASGSHLQPITLAHGLHEGHDILQSPVQNPDTTLEDETDDEPPNELPAQIQYNRPQSSLSSRRYRTPTAGSMASPPPIGLHASQQPIGYEIPSAFTEPQSASHLPSSYLAQGTYAGPFSHNLTLSPHPYPTPPEFRGQPQQISGRSFGVPARPGSRPTLEHAIENVQAHLAALTERLELLESVSEHPHRSNISLPTGITSPRYRRPGGSPTDRRGDYEWDLNDLGMWSLVLSPVTRVGGTVRQLAKFFATSEHSPTLIVVRRLCLDMSFLFCVLWVLDLVGVPQTVVGTTSGI